MLQLISIMEDHCSLQIHKCDTFRLKQYGYPFADVIFNHMFLNENACIFIEITLWVCRGSVASKSALV